MHSPHSHPAEALRDNASSGSGAAGVSYFTLDAAACEGVGQRHRVTAAAMPAATGEDDSSQVRTVAQYRRDNDLVQRRAAWDWFQATATRLASHQLYERLNAMSQAAAHDAGDSRPYEAPQLAWRAITDAVMTLWFDFDSVPAVQRLLHQRAIVDGGVKGATASAGLDPCASEWECVREAITAGTDAITCAAESLLTRLSRDPALTSSDSGAADSEQVEEAAGSGTGRAACHVEAFEAALREGGWLAP